MKVEPQPYRPPQVRTEVLTPTLLGCTAPHAHACAATPFRPALCCASALCLGLDCVRA